MTWSFDISAAPRGEWLHGTATRTDKAGKETIVETSEYQHEWVWLWSKCGKKVRSRWLPPTKFTPVGRWDGFANGEVPAAWHPYIVPADPVISKMQIAAAELADHLFLIDDVGAGA